MGFLVNAVIVQRGVIVEYRTNSTTARFSDNVLIDSVKNNMIASNTVSTKVGH